MRAGRRGGAAAAGAALLTPLVAGCASAGAPPVDGPGRPIERAAARFATEGPEAVITASGGGALRDETPPQRRFRLVGAPLGLGGGLGMRVVEEPNVLALPATERPTRVPEPEPEMPPEPGEPPRVIEIRGPR